MDIWSLCKCSGTQLCPFCKGLVVAGIVVICGVVGYLIGRRKKDKG